jgi:hypothetical protein
MENQSASNETENIGVVAETTEMPVGEVPVGEVPAEEMPVEEAVATTDNSFQNFEAQLVQGFLNVIARQNAMAPRLDPASRTTKIQSAIQKVQQMPDLGDYKTAIMIPTMDFEKAIVNGFLNNIYRKNLVQRTINKATGASTKEQRTSAIQNALLKVQQMPDLGSYILQSFTDAAKTSFSVAKNFGKGGKYHTKKRGKKTKMGGRKTKKGGRKTKMTKKGGRKTKMTKKRW